MLAAPLPQPPWGLLIGLYFIVVGLPTGLTLMTAYLGPGPGEQRRSVERRATATSLAVLGLASVLLVVDLHRPERFFLMVTEFGNLGSPISVGAKLIAIKVLLLAVALYFLRRRGKPAPGLTSWAVRGLTAALLVVSVALTFYPVSVLSFTWSSPLARTNGAYLVFLVTTLLMGAAGLLILIGLRTGPPEVDRLVRRAGLALAGLQLAGVVFEGWSLTADPAVPAGTLHRVLAGDYAGLFWTSIASVGFGAALLAPRTGRGRGRIAAGVLLLTGAALTRYLFFTVR